MFDSRIRRHPVQTFQFWFVVLTSFVGVTIWKLDLLSFSRPLPELVQEEPMPPPPGGEASATLDAFVDPDASPAPAQPAEAVTDSGPAMSPIARQLADHAGVQETAAMSLTGQREPVLKVDAALPADQHKTAVPASPVVTASAESASPELAEPSSSRPRRKPPVLDLPAVDHLVQKGEEVAAQRLMSGWYWKIPEARPQIMDRLNALARRIYFQSDIHYMDPYAVQFGDRLEKVAEACRVTPEYLLRLNHLDSSTLKVGQVLKVIQGPFGAVVDYGNQEMTVHAQGYFVARFQLKTGEGNSIPRGKFRVAEKYRPTGSPDPAANNPVFASQASGNWIRLEDPSGTATDFRIQGAGVGSLAEKGLAPAGLQLGDRELAALFDLLLIGSEVLVQP